MFTNLFLSRKEYDSLLNNNPQLLSKLTEIKHEWNLVGVIYYKVPDSLYIDAVKATQSN
jgi:hypothetical protein